MVNSIPCVRQTTLTKRISKGGLHDTRISWPAIRLPRIIFDWDVDFIRKQFEDDCEEYAEEPEALVSALRDEDPESDYDGFWDKVSTNLQTGNLRLLFVADRIPPELRRIVEFLNEQMKPTEVLAVELRQFEGSAQNVLVPAVMGLTSRGEAKRERDRYGRQWDEDSFLADMQARHGEGAVEVARRILRWVDPLVSRIWWGKGQKYGSFVPVIDVDDMWYGLFRVDTSRPGIQVYFAIFQSRGLLRIEDCTEIKDRLNTIDGVYLGRAEGYPTFDLLALASDDSFNSFATIFGDIIDTIKEPHSRPIS